VRIRSGFTIQRNYNINLGCYRTNEFGSILYCEDCGGPFSGFVQTRFPRTPRRRRLRRNFFIARVVVNLPLHESILSGATSLGRFWVGRTVRTTSCTSGTTPTTRLPSVCRRQGVVESTTRALANKFLIIFITFIQCSNYGGGGPGGLAP
jgi:hypothetical protein